MSRIGISLEKAEDRRPGTEDRRRKNRFRCFFGFRSSDFGFRSGFTLVEVMVSMIVLALLAAGFFSILVSARYLVNRSMMRMAALEIARQAIEQRKTLVRADTWWVGGSALAATGVWSTWAAYAPNPNYLMRTRVDSVAGSDCRKVSIQVRWNAAKI